MNQLGGAVKKVSIREARRWKKEALLQELHLHKGPFGRVYEFRQAFLVAHPRALYIIQALSAKTWLQHES